MFKDFVNHRHFDKNYVEDTDFKLVKDFRFGPRYFLGTAVFEKDEEYNVIKFVKPATEKEKAKLETLQYSQNDFNIYFEPRDIDHLFHSVIWGIMRIVPIIETFDNLNIYVPQYVYDIIFKGKDTLEEADSNLASYLKLTTNKKINFIKIDLNNIPSKYFIINNYLIVHVASKHGINQEVLDIVTKNIKDFSMPDGISDKIYLSRNEKKYIRVPENEQEFAKYFEQKGFSVLELENYSIKDQMRIVMNAKIVLGWSGSSFTNILFSNNDKILIDFTYLPDKTEYYGKRPHFEKNSTPGAMDPLLNRYDFDWSMLAGLVGATYMKINFEKIDTCDQAIDILEKNIWFKKILGE